MDFFDEPITRAIPSIFAPVREKYFHGREDCSGPKSPMYELFGPCKYAKVWDLIRKLTYQICGREFAIDPENKDQSRYVAEKLCELVYDLRNEHLEEYGDDD